MDLVEVVLPEARGLSTDVPQREVVVFVLDLLDVEAHGRHGFAELLVAHLKEQGGLARVVESQEQNFLVLLGVAVFPATCQCLFT